MFNEHMARLLGAVAAAGPRILDAGCGRADTSLWLAKQGCDVTGVDLALPFSMDERVRITGDFSGHLVLWRADLLTLAELTPFDATAALGVLHTLGSADQVNLLLHRLAAWTRPGGLIAISWLLDAEPPTRLHQCAHFPSQTTVLAAARELGLHDRDVWTTQIEHAHGGGPAHRHTVCYSTWLVGEALV